ncbi:acyl carrier protein [Azospirillum sp. A26]|uniref:acyl carrier protein n=1 Tax=Azospirillum sp. A26 TaxID=3160607 RepID=UPI00367252E2
MTTFERLQKLLADVIGTEIEPTPIERHARFLDDLGADSLDAVEIQFAIEEEFGVEIDDGEFDEIITVDDLVKRIDSAVPADA